MRLEIEIGFRSVENGEILEARAMSDNQHLSFLLRKAIRQPPEPESDVSRMASASPFRPVWCGLTGETPNSVGSGLERTAIVEKRF